MQLLVAILGLIPGIIAATIIRKASLGFDFGTSGVRCCLISSTGDIHYEDALLWNEVDDSERSPSSTKSWNSALHQIMKKIPHDEPVERICVSGTSASALIYDVARRQVSRQPRMYDFNILRSTSVGSDVLNRIRGSHCPDGSPAVAPTSTLAKLLAWNSESPLLQSEKLVHQADYIVSQIMFADEEPTFQSDWHNALKLGYDVLTLRYPDWLTLLLQECNIDPTACLPRVAQPGVLLAFSMSWRIQMPHLNRVPLCVQGPCLVACRPLSPSNMAFHQHAKLRQV